MSLPTFAPTAETSEISLQRKSRGVNLKLQDNELQATKLSLVNVSNWPKPAYGHC